ncbi:hypothetical protein ABN242_00695 [Providencia alcalifaciens]|uniref:hypothetical protein n=1 Tax=Providencia alcalifaciens TaxID=126385 RepID=UPI0032DBA252
MGHFYSKYQFSLRYFLSSSLYLHHVSIFDDVYPIVLTMNAGLAPALIYLGAFFVGRTHLVVLYVSPLF